MKIEATQQYLLTLSAEEYEALRPALEQLAATPSVKRRRRKPFRIRVNAIPIVQPTPVDEEAGGLGAPFVAGAQIVIKAPRIAQAMAVDEEAANARLLDAIRTDRVPSLDELAELERRPRPTSIAGQQVARPLFITPSGESPSSTETTARIVPTPRGKVAHDLHAAQAKEATRVPAKDDEPMSHIGGD